MAGQAGRGRGQDARAWYLDALSAAAFAALAVFLGRALRMVPLVGIVVFLICAGFAWFFGRSAWRGICAARG